MKRLIIVLLLIAVLMIPLFGCSKQPEAITPLPSSSTTTYTRNSFTIRVTGNIRVKDPTQWALEEKDLQHLNALLATFTDAQKKQYYFPAKPDPATNDKVVTEAHAMRDAWSKKWFSAPNIEDGILYMDSPTVTYSGSYMIVGLNGSSASKSVDGVTPSEYTVTGNVVSCTFQKRSESGYLKVEILKGDKVIASSDTSASYGAVSVATN